MGKLLRFDKKIRTERKRAAMPGTAELLFFTGVRYERAESGAKRTGTVKRSRKRG